VGGLLSAALRAEGPVDFGTATSILQVPASAFQPTCSGYGYVVNGGGYLFLTGAIPVQCADPAAFWAPVQLPSGTLITSFDLYFLDTNAFSDMSAFLRAYTGCCGSDGVVDLATAASSGSGGEGFATTSLSYTVKNDAAGDPNGAMLSAVVALPGEVFWGFKGVAVHYQRQVSPAPGVSTFNDVPTNHPFFQFIEALYAAGITSGCNTAPLLYCPDNSLTRGQMAVFLAKALGLQFPN
jgi:hypothetical protein